MSEAQVIAFPLPDATARRRIQGELETNLLVEAGAGSGKTTELVNRMVGLVATGTTTVDRIAAVTFTRKAAGELRERFQARLEREVREAKGDAGEVARIRQALDDMDRAFVGTIHAFCSRLLRERPLEVGLDPAFQELAPEERLGFHRRFWEAYLERLVRDADPILEELNEAGLRTHHLFGLFGSLVENPDVDFPAGDVSPPSPAEISAVRKELEVLVRRGRELMPDREPEKGWDSFQKKVRTAAFTLEVTGWKRPSDFFEALSLLCHDGKGHATTLNRWKDKDMAKALVASANAFGHGDTAATRLVDRWYAHRYALALRLAGKAAQDFAEHRRRSGRLDFQDLLLLTARLLRGNDDARRELGRRFRHLLVDEFQDTDPLQAEIMMLLASEPGGEGASGGDGGPGDQAAGPGAEGAVQGAAGNGASPGGGADALADWRTAVPRPGALFVVGDPKQSIYRFRRADIQLYEFVKRRFVDFGGVLELTSNFRSRPAIGDLVNQVFDHPDFFPDQATAEQARFEPLNTRPTERSAPAEGVFWYAVDPSRDAWAGVATDDARRLATWIRQRLDRGERGAGDFLILTRVTRSLSIYARALEESGIPVQVTGAGVGVEHELEELLTLLECMVDPTDPVKVVAVLVGLFFGLDHERLLTHHLAGGNFDVVRPRGEGDPEVRTALGVLHRWWRSASREPADVFLGRVVPELGLLPFAAAGELGMLRAGALVYVLDAVRGAALAGDASLPGALDALGAALEAREAEAPLQPGRDDVVRLMNLHQAKGLEAPVVVLADPSSPPSHGQSLHVERRPDGIATGWLRVAQESEGFKRNNLLAKPPEWAAKEAAETRFESAEQVRLLYVAATRARDELVVSRWPAKASASAWASLDGWLVAHGREMVLDAAPPPDRQELRLSPDVMARRVAQAAEALEILGTPSFRHVSVTDVAKAGAATEKAQAPPAVVDAPSPGSARFRGYSWGSAVHGALAAAAEDDAEVPLRAACRALLVEHGRPLNDHGDPTELEELVALVRSVRASELWTRAAKAGRVLAEVPFAVPGVTRPPPARESEPGPEPDTARSRPPQRQLDLFGGEAPPAAGPATGTGGADQEPDPVPSVLEGVIDLAFREKGGWVIADYKTDVGTDPDFPARLDTYRRQVDLYAEAWARLTGEPVKERILYFTAQGRVDAW